MGLSKHLRRLIGRPDRPVVSQVAFAGLGEDRLGRLVGAAKTAGLGFFLGGASDPGTRRLHVRNTDRPALLAVLRSAFANDPSVLVRFEARPPMSLDAALSRWPSDLAGLDLLFAERSAKAGRRMLHACSVLQLDIWSPFDAPNSEVLYETKREQRYFSRIRAHSLDHLLRDRVDLDAEEPPDIYRHSFPIDAVYTWVNNQDPAWVSRMMAHSPKSRHQQTFGRAHHPERFRNWDELRYSLRSLEMYAPFVRNIFIVTDDQTPDWLDDAHPRIKVVSHRGIFSDATALPCFNSSAIETQLHHIDGLAEHFIYLNDDMLLGQYCTADDFFLPNGVAKFFPSLQRAYAADIDDTREEYLIADRNVIDIMRRESGAWGRQIMLHAPYPSRRSFLSSLEQKYAEAFARCAAQRFRSTQDIRPIAFMQYHLGFPSGLYAPGTISHRYLALWKPQIGQQLLSVARMRAHKTLCINDVGLPDDRAGDVKGLVSEFLDEYFPFKSAFEK
jgi:hypothetical protein